MDITSLLVGLAVGAAIAGTAYFGGLLTMGGAFVAALLAGFIYAAGGLIASGALLTFFLTSSLLTKLPRTIANKTEAKNKTAAQRRTAAQVLQNGGAGAVMLLLQFVGLEPWLALTAFLGCVACANADTWATEIGSRFGGIPRSLRTFQPLPAGESGGVTLMGTAASVAGAALIALFTLPNSDHPTYLVVLAAGMFGALFDSFLGATLQVKYHCAFCGGLEAPCPHNPSKIQGANWMQNGTVNALSTLAAGIAILIVTYFSSRGEIIGN